MPRTAEKLPSFLERFAKQPSKLLTSSKVKGAPHTIVVTGAGLRAANLTRELRIFQTKDSIIAKLFAKHIKLKDTVKFLKNTR
jgi:protein CMS1